MAAVCTGGVKFSRSMSAPTGADVGLEKRKNRRLFKKVIRFILYYNQNGIKMGVIIYINERTYFSLNFDYFMEEN